jgi:hypothetical protein
MAFVPPVPDCWGGRDLRNQQASKVQWAASRVPDFLRAPPMWRGDAADVKGKAASW